MSGTQWKPLDWCFGDQTSVKYKKKPGRLHSWARQWTVLLDHPCMCWFKLAGSPWCGELPNMVLQVTVDAFLLLDPLLVTGAESSWGWMDMVPTRVCVLYDFGDSWKYLISSCLPKVLRMSTLHYTAPFICVCSYRLLDRNARNQLLP